MWSMIELEIEVKIVKRRFSRDVSVSELGDVEYENIRNALGCIGSNTVSF